MAQRRCRLGLRTIPLRIDAVQGTLAGLLTLEVKIDLFHSTTRLYLASPEVGSHRPSLLLGESF